MRDGELGIGQQIPDDPTDPDTTAPQSISDADLARALGDPAPVASPGAAAPVAEDPEPDLSRLQDLAPPEPEKKADAPAGDPPPEPELSQADIDRQKFQAELDKRDAEIALQKAHGSRLAGRLGFLEKKLGGDRTERDAASEFGDETDTLAKDVAELKEGARSEKVVRMVHGTIAEIKDHADLKGLGKDELASLLAPHEATLEVALSAQDPETARLFADALTKAILADARSLRLTKLEASATERNKAELARLKARKGESGPVRSVPQRMAAQAAVKDPAQMTDSEYSRYVDSLISTRG